jgi:hypothetical protein
MREDLLQFIWAHGYFNHNALATQDGRGIAVIDPGRLNRHQGPDFLDARIRIDGIEWAGNVELHVLTSDWHRHGHDPDPRYQRLVLHVVWKHDGNAPMDLPVLELYGRVPGTLLQTFTAWMNQPDRLPCAASLGTTINQLPQGWRDILLDLRLHAKASQWLEELAQLKGHWDELCWRKLARNFGHRVNADAFEQVARSLPLRILHRHSGQIHQLEALLFGQAGLLWGNWEDPYPVMLQKEFAYLKKLHALKPAAVLVHFLRMRPGNFPTVRLAQLAMLMHSTERLSEAILRAEDVSALETLFDVTANDFWHYHYRFGKASSYAPKRLGAETIRNILINTAVPFVYAYGQWSGNASLCMRAKGWLEALPAERDQSLQVFRDAGLQCVTAADSQALHSLYRDFCVQKHCLSCAIGELVIDRTVRSATSAGGIPAI